MNRAFNEHIKRKTFLLDGIWEFKTDSTDIGEKEEWYKSFPTTDVMETAVPSCINTRLGMMEYFGVCWYKKTFSADDIFLPFDVSLAPYYAGTSTEKIQQYMEIDDMDDRSYLLGLFACVTSIVSIVIAIITI
jgi:hypothetical protein